MTKEEKMIAVVASNKQGYRDLIQSSAHPLHVPDSGVDEMMRRIAIKQAEVLEQDEVDLLFELSSNEIYQRLTNKMVQGMEIGAQVAQDWLEENMPSLMGGNWGTFSGAN